MNTSAEDKQVIAHRSRELWKAVNQGKDVDSFNEFMKTLGSVQEASHRVEVDGVMGADKEAASFGL